MSTLETINRKIKPLSEAIKLVNTWKGQGEEIVFTNGCFDLLHQGHLQYLAQARDLGQRLVVGLNSDASVRRLKGVQRPIHDLGMRQLQLASLVYVDMVVTFEEDTPLHLIQALTPDVLVKGADYRPEEIVGAAWVLEHGGRVHTLQYLEGHSTSALLHHIKRLEKV